MRGNNSKTSKRKPAAAAPGDRKHPSRRKLSQPRESRYIGSSARSGAGAIRDGQPPAIKISLAGRCGTAVDLVTLRKGTCLLDTEEKILQALEDLYPLIFTVKGFKDNNRWSDKSSPAEVFHDMFLKLHNLIENESIVLSLRDGHYKLSMMVPVYFDISCPNLPVYFVAALEPIDKTLFNLCFYLVVYVMKRIGIGDWEEENENYIYGQIEEGLSYMKTEYGSGDHEKEIAELEEAYRVYGKNGEATKFHKRLLHTSCSKKIWLKEFSDYKPRTQIEKDIYQWLEQGKKLMEQDDSIHNYIHISKEIMEDYEGGGEKPVTPDESVKVMWRNDDFFFQEFYRMVESMHSNSGGIPYYLLTSIEKPSDFTAIKTCFPEQLLAFFEQGRKLEEKYREVFREPAPLKKAFIKKAKPLIDILT